MAKVQKGKRPQAVTPPPRNAEKSRAAEPAALVFPASPQPVFTRKWSFSLLDFKVQAIIISLVAFGLYFNTFYNEYAHDDGIVIVKNEYVQEGFAGIWDIMTKDAYDSYYRQLNTINQLQGGRYRPLSIVTFAIEQQFLGAVSKNNVDSIMKQNIAFGVHGEQEKKLIHDMHVRHVFNVLWFILSLIALLYFLRYVVMRNDPLMAFVATLLFAIHPIHTEVIANVKSRDEIMSLLFICTTFILTFKYAEKKDVRYLVAAVFSYLLAFLSKEYAITLAVLLPLSLYLFAGYKPARALLTFVPFLAAIAIYLALRFHIVTAQSENSDSEVLNNPYYFASDSEKLATEIATCLNYMKLLIFPHPLSADYSYNSIPYVKFGNLKVLLSMIVYGAMSVGMFLLLPLKKVANMQDAEQKYNRGILCFATAFFLAHFALVCNIIFDIGATMGERLIYHSSVGFCIAVAWLLVRGAEKIKPATAGAVALGCFLLVVTVLGGMKTIARNADWKNDRTLFAADLNTVPNSVLVVGNVAASCITEADYQKNEADRQAYLHRAIGLLDHALTIHRTFVAGFLNRGIAYYKLGQIDSAKANLDTVAKLYPTYPTLPGMYKLLADYYMKEGWNKYGKNGNYPQAIIEFKKGLAIDQSSPELWYNYGGALFSNKQYEEAIAAWKMALKLKPDYAQAQAGMQAAMGALAAQGGAPPNAAAPSHQK